jgi:hypothetical protein
MPPRKRWPLALAASLFGLGLLGILATIRDKNGHEAKIETPDDIRSVQSVDPSGTLGIKSSKGGSEVKGAGPASVAGEAANPSASKPTASPAEENGRFRPGAIWVGSITFENSNLVGEVWSYLLTVTERSGDHFEAAATGIHLGGKEGLSSLTGTVGGSRINAVASHDDGSKALITGDISGREMRFKWDNTDKGSFGHGTLTYQGPMEPRPPSTPRTSGDGVPVIEEGADRLSLIGRWDHMVGTDPGEIELMANGVVRGGPWRGSWTLNGDRLTLRWPRKRAPGQAWVDELEVVPDRTTYSGANQKGVLITGRRIGDGGYAGMPTVKYTPVAGSAKGSLPASR